METAEKRVMIASSSQRKRKRRKIRRIIRKRRRRNEKLVTAPSSLPNDVIEEIFLRLPVKALIRLKSLSKQWRVVIESLSFAERHLKIAEQYRLVHPKVMVITDEKETGWTLRPDTDIGFRTFCLESVNPATRWLRQLPPSRFQISMHKFYPTREDWRFMDSLFHLAFVKAAAGYKLVWLYNCENYNADASFPSEGVTKCEVFDFRANTWRYLSCTPSYRIFYNQKPAYANGSVYWLTEPYNARIEVVAFDIQTETFRLLPNIIVAIADSDPNHIDMCSLDNHLCMSKREHVTMIQDIWRLKPSEDTWEKIFSIDLISCHSPRTEIRDMFEWSQKDMVEPSTPVAVCKNKKILLSHRCSRGLVKYDPLTKSLDFFYRNYRAWRKVTYFQSLISHI